MDADIARMNYSDYSFKIGYTPTGEHLLNCIFEDGEMLINEGMNSIRKRLN